MPFRVGIDLVSVETIADSITTLGDRYLERVYSPGELDDCTRAESPDPKRLAACFAGKEAAMKVLQPPKDLAIPWQDIEIRRDSAGKARLTMTGRAAKLAADAGVLKVTLSLTHERGIVSALVVAEVATSCR